MKAHRLARVAEVVREVASETILFELRDPRVKKTGVTVIRAEVSGDLQHAKVFVSVMGSLKDQQLCLYGLRHAAGFIQSKLADRLQTRFTPVIHFELDQGVKKSIEMTRLINESLGQSPPAHDALESGEPQGESPTSESPGEPGPSATGGPGESETPVTGGEG